MIDLPVEAAGPERVPRNARDYWDAQRMSAARLGFSVTQACPLKCAHCSVDAGPAYKSTTFGEHLADRVTEQISSLAGVGIRYIDFTGGEPTLAARFVRLISEEAAHWKLSSSIVTAAHWATSEDRALAFIASFPHVKYWDISADIYHLPFVPISNIHNAFVAAEKLGRQPLLRVAHHEPLTMEDAVLIDTLYTFAGERISFQGLGSVGRGTTLTEISRVIAGGSLDPCPTTGPLVRHTGVVAPCCAPLSHVDFHHPLILGSLHKDPLVEIIRRWRTNPLLQTIRLWGFAPLLEWLRDGGILNEQVLADRVCYQCVDILRDQRMTAYCWERANQLSHKIDLAVALYAYLDEPWMDFEVRKAASGALQADPICA